MKKNRKNNSYIQLKEFLLQGRSLNSLIAEKEFGIKHNTCCYYIHKIRKEGYNVISTLKESYTGRRYVEYKLDIIDQKKNKTFLDGKKYTGAKTLNVEPVTGFTYEAV